MVLCVIWMVMYLHLLDLLLPSIQKNTTVLAQICSVGEWMSFLTLPNITGMLYWSSSGNLLGYPPPQLSVGGVGVGREDDQASFSGTHVLWFGVYL